jgi:hypothetical protein
MLWQFQFAPPAIPMFSLSIVPSCQVAARIADFVTHSIGISVAALWTYLPLLAVVIPSKSKPAVGYNSACELSSLLP